MKTRRSVTPTALALPDADALSALRAWHEGLSSREAVERFIATRLVPGESARGVIGRIRREVYAFARSQHRDDVAELFAGPACKGVATARAVAAAIELLRTAALPTPLIGDEVECWLEPRVAQVLAAAGIRTLAGLTLRVPRRSRWWTDIAGLGVAGARRVEAFFAAHPELTERARGLVVRAPSSVVPWDDIVVPHEVDGTAGMYRAPRASCALRADNDYDAVHA